MSPRAGYKHKKLRLSMETCMEDRAAYEAGESLNDIARRRGLTRAAIQYRLKRAGATTRNHSDAGALWSQRKGYKGPGLYRERHYNWKGGRTILKGYVVVMAKDHPRVSRHGYMPEHVLVAERKIGRYLLPNEVAHHINGDKLDNRPENIEVMTRSEHCKHHLPRLGTGRKSA